MKKINEANQLTKLDTSYLTVKGDQLALEDRKTGKVYITTKPHINKLFKDMGYRSLNVVNILREFAGKIISNVGDLKTVNVYADELESSCIIATSEAIQWTKNLSEFLDEKGFTLISSKCKDSCRSFDEYIFKSTNGTYFVIDVNFVGEYVSLYSINDYDSEVKIMYENYFYMNEKDSIEDIKATLLSKINLSTSFDDSAFLSVSEYADFLSKLGFIKKGRKSWSITDLGEEEILAGTVPKIDQTVELINELSWIKSHIESSGVSFKEMSKILTYYEDIIFISDFNDFYHKNSTESSDYFLVK